MDRPAFEAAASNIQYDVIDGVRTLWADIDGPMTARLSFRVGESDEPLPWHGVSHLVEHLALTTLGQPGFAINGSVDATRTTFDVHGHVEEVTLFLEAVGNALASPPEQRIDVEKRLLEIEARSRGSAAGEHDRVRFGPRGYGISGCREVGLEWIGASELHRWLAHYFTQGNAVLWLSRPPPAGLRLPLPDGESRASRPVEPISRTWPSWWSEPDAGVSLSATGERGWSMSASAWLIRRRLFSRLRLNDGIAYSVEAFVTPLSTQVSRLLVAVDSSPESATRALSGIREELGRIAAEPMTDEELDLWRRESEIAPANDTLLGLLDRSALATLEDRGPESFNLLERQRLNVDALAVRDITATLLKTSLLLVPDPTRVTEQGWHELPRWSTTSISTGTTFAPERHHPEGARLLVGPDGIMTEYGLETRLTVKWSACEAVIVRPDDARTIVGSDGIAIDVNAHDWQDRRELLAAIDRFAPAAVTAHVDSDPGIGPPERLRGLAASSTSVLVILLVALLLSAAGLATIITFSDPGTVIVEGVLVASALGVVVPLRRRLRAPKDVRNAPALRGATNARVDRTLARSSLKQVKSIAIVTWILAATAGLILLAAHVSPWPAILPMAVAVRASREWRRQSRR